MRYLAKMLLTAAVVMWSGLLVAGPAIAFETDSVEKLGFELSTLKILGINQMWNLEETKRHFEEEGVSELDLRGQMAFGKYLESLLPEIAPVLSEEISVFGGCFRYSTCRSCRGNASFTRISSRAIASMSGPLAYASVTLTTKTR